MVQPFGCGTSSASLQVGDPEPLRASGEPQLTRPQCLSSSFIPSTPSGQTTLGDTEYSSSAGLPLPPLLSLVLHGAVGVERQGQKDQESS